jgi:Cupredoxin-like domain
MRIIQVPAVLLLAASMAMPVSARSDAPFTLELTLKDHQFEPAELKAPANRPIEITLKNEDDGVEEFDSNSLRTEKIVTNHATITIKLKPLAAGRYPFQGEYHAKTAQGMLVVE